MHFFGMILFGLLTLLLIVAEYYLKSMYVELEILRAENETLKRNWTNSQGANHDRTTYPRH